MDRNTIIGVILIALVLIGFSIINKPNPTTSQPSVATERVVEEATSEHVPSVNASATTESDPTSMFASVQDAKEEKVYLKNSKVELVFSTRGGALEQAQLTQYEAQEEKPLVLFTKDDAFFNIPLRTVSGKVVDTKELNFTPVQLSDTTLIMRLAVDSLAHLDFRYTLHKDDYRLGFAIEGENLERLFPSNLRFLDLEMGQKLRRQEKSWKNENQYSAIYYKLLSDDVDHLSDKSEVLEDVKERLHWIAFKDKYFATVWIADRDNAFEATQMKQKTLTQDGDYTKECTITTSVPFSNRDGVTAGFTLYMGPLEHYALKAYDEGVAKEERMNLEHLVYVGGSVFRWINVTLIMPLVNFLAKYISNWGIIILLLTLIIKTVLFPLTFKSYVSQAKMRVLKPQVQAINEKYAGNDQQMMMKRSQETMSLYRAAGASPMSGCLPMLLQMPFLISLYMFFPTAIALRGESFLWAEDLSTYDAVLTWSFDIPILSGLMGNHLSLFCLLWAVTNILYSQYTMGQNAVGDNQQMKMMKWMPYIMSIMFFFMFNSNSSGLCYYYFVSTLITIIQFVASRLMINEDKVLAKLEENKKKPRKKSGFMARLEEAQRLQQQQMRAQQKKK